MKRIGIFSVDDSYPAADGEKLYLLREMGKCLDKIIIVINTRLPEKEKKKLLIYSDEIYEDIGGYDANRWKFALHKLYRSHRIRKYGEIVLWNDSFFGPLYPFRDVFRKMEGEDADFWGLTMHGKIAGRGAPEFLQCYFLVFRNGMAESGAFRYFWKSVQEFPSHDIYERKFEFALTGYFEKHGFRKGIYADAGEEGTESAPLSDILFQPYRMIVRYGLPVVSKYFFQLDKKITLSYHTGAEANRVLDYVREETDYDINLIYRFLVKRYNLYDLRSRLNLNMVLPAGEAPREHGSCGVREAAVFAHLFYEDLFDESLAYLRDACSGMDIYITTDTEDKVRLLESKREGFDIPDAQVGRCSCNGREWAAWLLSGSGKMRAYKYFCLIHDKKSRQMHFRTVGKSFGEGIWENMLSGREYVENILRTFERNPHIGLMVPPEVYHGTYFHTSIDFWTMCFEETRKLGRKLGLSLLLDERRPPVAVGSAFWCRWEAVQNFFCLPFTENDFPAEPMPVDGSINHAYERILPYIAQANGFYTYTVMTESYAGVHIANYQEMLREILGILKRDGSLNLATYECTLQSLGALIGGGKKEGKGQE